MGGCKVPLPSEIQKRDRKTLHSNNVADSSELKWGGMRVRIGVQERGRAGTGARKRERERERAEEE